MESAKRLVARLAAPAGDFGTAEAAGRLAALLWLLCGVLVIVGAPLLPAADRANRIGVALVGVLALVIGTILAMLPWRRWGRSSTLFIVPLALGVIALHNALSGNDGFRYAVFFLVAFAWIGLAHPPTMSLRFAPLLAVAYLVPGVATGAGARPLVSGIAYALPACVLVGETCAWVAERIRRSEHELAISVASLRESEASFRLLFASNPQPMWVYDLLSLAFVEVNDAAVAHYGYTREQFLAMKITDIRPSEDVPAMIAALDRRGRSYEASGPWRHRLADGRVIDVEVSSHRLAFGGRDVVLVAASDVTDRFALERQLRHQAFHDALTNLANRALFSDRVENALDRATATAGSAAPVVLLLDLDGFKLVNDSLGHTVGDDLLVAVADRLRAALRPGDTAARLGGDEFAVLLDAVDDAVLAVDEAERLRHAVSFPYRLDGRDIVIGVSVGIALCDAGASAGDLLRNADMAMYQAKADGKGCSSLFAPEMYEAAVRRVELDAGLRRALDAREFEVWYQPTLSLANGAVAGVEALVRWRHPEKGIVEPGEFIEAAEASGLIRPLGEWVLETACAQVLEWEASIGPSAADLGVSVNLSARQLADPSIVEQVVGALERTGLDPERLTLEITETVLMADRGVAVERLGALKAIGVRLAIDDFGTGYSSFRRLRSFPVDELKIDKSFVDDVDEDDRDRVIVEAIVRLGQALGLETVAEGVERPSQLEELAAVGCDRAQGFHLARPMPAWLVTGFLRAPEPSSVRAPALPTAPPPSEPAQPSEPALRAERAQPAEPALRAERAQPASITALRRAKASSG